MNRSSWPQGKVVRPLETLIIDDPEKGGSEAGAWANAGYAEPHVDDARFVATVGCATVDVFHNGIFWVMRFAERAATNRITLGEDLAQMTRLSDAFARALLRFHGQSPLVMVGGVAFHIEEALAMRDLLTSVVLRT